ncbi:MAG: GTPase, partial [Candidatus Bathyarchaeia archaeon]
MPTNLPAEAKRKWAEVSAARNPREKIQLMQEFLSLVPKHKGTAKLCAQVKKQMAVLRREIEEKKHRKAGRGGPKFFIEKEGAAQIALLGLTNSGKSSLLRAITNAKVEVSPAPYTTREPIPGIMNYEDIQFQIIEAPALMEGSADGKAWGLQTLALARNADGLILVIDLSQDPVNQFLTILGELEKARISVFKPRGRVEIEKKHMGFGLRIIVVGRLVDCTLKDVEELLKSYRVIDAIVKISGEVTLDEVEDAIFESTVYKPAIIVANKADANNAKNNLNLLESHVNSKLPILAVSCEKRYGFEKLGETLFKALDIIRVYTKEPSEKAHSEKPFILRKGATVYDLARNIHSDFSEHFSFAKVWSRRLVF